MRRLRRVGGALAALAFLLTWAAGSPGVSLAVADGYTAVAAGRDHTCALRATGTVDCWGWNGAGQLGRRSTREHSAVPAAVRGITTATAIAAGGTHTCAIVGSGAVRCWGDNDTGQLGNGTTRDSAVPVSVRGITNAVAISQAGTATCALLSSGTVQCWGFTYIPPPPGVSFFSDHMGVTSIPRDIPGVSSAVAISVGHAHRCALLSSGVIRCWGFNNDGQLGNGTTAVGTVPVDVPGIASAAAIGAGEKHTCALLAGGSIQCWGGNSRRQLGNGSGQDSAVPIGVTGIAAASAVAAGGEHACALLVARTISCWGYGYYGQLGNGSSRDNSPVSVRGITSAVMIAAGQTHTCALLATGAVSCWGSNTSGQLGNGTTESSNVPVVARDTSAASSAPSGPVSGVVLVRLPGSGTFVRLLPGQELPPGSEVDAKRGRVRITPPGQGSDSAVFYGGIFIYRQLRERGRLLTELALSEPLSCPRAAVVQAKKPVRRRRLWGDGKGGFRTRGNHATAGVRGTRWLTADTCTTTRVRVARGMVAVRDLVRNVTVIVRAGGSYTARRR